MPKLNSNSNYQQIDWQVPGQALDIIRGEPYRLRAYQKSNTACDLYQAFGKAER